MMRVQTYSVTDFPKELFLELTSTIYGSPRTDKLPKNSEYQSISYFLFEDDQVRATATIFINPALSKEGKKISLIGNFEAIECDCSLLFQAIENDAKQQGATQLIGPMNGSTWNDHRFIIGEHGVPFLSEIAHPNYYPSIWEKSNFNVFQSYFSYRDLELDSNDERLVKLERHFEKLDLRLRTISLADFETELVNIYQLCMRAFSENVLYSEISQEQFIASYAPMKSFLNEDYIWLAENKNNECLGFLFAFENKRNTTENELIVKTIAKHPSFRFNGLGTLLGNRFMKKARENGVTSVIHAFMHENNVSKNLSQRFNGEKIRSYALLAKNVKHA